MSLPAYAKQELKYYRLLEELVDNLELSKSETERVKTELDIIHYGCNCKHVYALYLLTQKCKEDNQYYVLRGTGSDTLLFFALGISNINPHSKSFSYPLPYQIGIGIIDEPKNLGDEIQVSPSYVRKLQKYVEKNFSNDSDIYKAIDLKNNRFIYNKFKMILIPKDDDPYKYGDYIEAYDKSGFLSCFRGMKNSTNLTVLGMCEMPDASLMYDDIESEQFKKRYNKFLKTISSKKTISDSTFVHKKHYLSLDKERFDIYKENFLELCLDVCRQINLDKDMSRNIIRCREDAWNIINKLELSEKDKYNIYNQVYYGRFINLDYNLKIKRKYKRNHKQIIKELNDAESIFPLIHVMGFIKRDIDSI